MGRNLIGVTKEDTNIFYYFLQVFLLSFLQVFLKNKPMISISNHYLVKFKHNLFNSFMTGTVII